MTRAILTDIEGTTTSIAFVHDVLFPYAAQSLPAYVRDHTLEHADLLDQVRVEASEADASVERVIEILLQWIDEDRKATALKALQGFIWTHGYQTGAFAGHVYPDAVAGLKRWHKAGLGLYVYSSGSVEAQRLLFAYSEAGDLSPLFSGYFDTKTGPKRVNSSYSAIAREVGNAPSEILFLSDVSAELDAASEVGMRALQVVRDDSVVVGKHPVVKNFDDIDLQLG